MLQILVSSQFKNFRREGILYTMNFSYPKRKVHVKLFFINIHDLRKIIPMILH